MLSSVLLLGLYMTLARAQSKKLRADHENPSGVYRWHLKTAGTYLGALLGIGTLVCFAPNFVSAYLAHASSSSNMVVEHITAPQKISFSQNRQLFDTGPDIKLLQEYLNGHGYVLAQSGPGSPGNETDVFGPLTYNALKEFQSANGIHADGYFGWSTREIMNASEGDYGIVMLPN